MEKRIKVQHIRTKNESSRFPGGANIPKALPETVWVSNPYLPAIRIQDKRLFSLLQRVKWGNK
jgi:hypothetical protein